MDHDTEALLALLVEHLSEQFGKYGDWSVALTESGQYFTIDIGVESVIDWSEHA